MRKRLRPPRFLGQIKYQHQLLIMLLLLNLSAIRSDADILTDVYGGRCAVDGVYLRLRAANLNVDYKQLSRELEGRKENAMVSLSKVKEVLQNYGIAVRAVKADLDALTHMQGWGLALMEESVTKEPHLVLVRFVNGGVEIRDPALSGNVIVSTYEDFNKLWKNIILLCP